MIASGRPFKGLTASPAGRPQQRSLKGSLSVYVCGGHFKENTTLSVIVQGLRNHGVMMIKYYFWIGQAARLFDGKEKILAQPKATRSLGLLFQQEGEPGPDTRPRPGNSPDLQVLGCLHRSPGISDLQGDTMTLSLLRGAPEANTLIHNTRGSQTNPA